MAHAGADARDPDNEWRTHQPVRVIPVTFTDLAKYDLHPFHAFHAHARRADDGHAFSAHRLRERAP